MSEPYTIPIECRGDTADVLVYDQIGKSFFDEGLTAKSFAENLKALGKGIRTINVRINSPGGSVFDGTAIYNTLRSHGAKVVTHIEGGALSIASLIAMAGDERRMAKNGYIMVHDPVSFARGRADDMRKAADMLDKVKATLVDTYSERTGHDKADVAKMMSDETWLTAQDAKDLGFIDSVTDDVKAIAQFDPQSFTNVPVELLNLVTPREPAMSEPKPATIQELKAACPNADPSFLMAQLEASATVEAASKAWTAELASQLAAAKAELAKKPAAPAAPAAGVEPLPAGGGKPEGGAGAGGDPIAEFQEAVAAEVKRGKPHHAATAIVCRKNPELRAAYVAAHNTLHSKR